MTADQTCPTCGAEMCDDDECPCDLGPDADPYERDYFPPERTYRGHEYRGLA